MPHPYFKKIAYTPPERRRLPRPRVTSRKKSRRAWSLKSGQWLGRLILAGLFAGVLLILVGLGAFAWYGRSLPSVENLTKRTAETSTKIYDRTGEFVLYEIHGDRKRTEVKLNNLPQYIKDATLVAEDRNFYAHQGFDLKGFVRALFLNVFTNQRPGGSTITQQLVKNTIVGNEKTYSRKIKELILAYRIEQEFSKDEILEMYLNSIPYGGSAYGIEVAAERYFSKQANELTLAESAVLAALPQAPSFLSPYGGNKDRLIARQQYILNNMMNLGYIDNAARDKALAEELQFAPLKDQIIAPHFVFYIRELLSAKYGERMVESGGLKIITTLDLYMQKIAEEEVLAGAEKNEEKYEGSNAALVALDPKTGYILAMVGSRDYFDEEIDGQVNVTVRPRQPGSSFKPIVYAASFIKGFTPDTILYDVNTTFKTDTKDYNPRNYDLIERGPVTIKQALAGSLNIPAVKTLYLTGINNVLDLAYKLGYTTLTDRSRFGLSLVLGGGEVKLLEHTAAYQALARDGIYRPPVGILKVEDAQGNILESYKEETIEAMPTNVSRQITNILSDNEARSFVFGGNSALQLGERPVAAKTGTTNDYRDGWTIGYTPSLVAGVWVGNNDNSPMKRGAGGSSVAAPIWNNFMRRVLGDTPIETFREPDPVNYTGNQALYGLIPATMTVVVDRISGKLATDLTPADYREEKTFKELHSILHYINKQDPKGPAPENPDTDPNYESWEQAVRTWAEANGEELGLTAPTELDNVHTPANQPKLIITSPTPEQTIRGQFLNVTVIASAPLNISEIGLFLDDKFLGVLNESGTFNAPLEGTLTGFHKIRVDAFDEVGNKSSKEVIVNYIP